MNFASRTLLVASAALALSACTRAPAQPLSSVKAPAGFTFQATRSIALQLSASAAALPQDAREGHIRIARKDGKVIFSGPMRASHPIQVNLTVPLKEQELVATLNGRNGLVTSPIAIREGKATIQF